MHVSYGVCSAEAIIIHFYNIVHWSMREYFLGFINSLTAIDGNRINKLIKKAGSIFSLTPDL